MISGRREQVLQDACQALAAEGVDAHYAQVRAAPGGAAASACCSHLRQPPATALIQYPPHPHPHPPRPSLG